MHSALLFAMCDAMRWPDAELPYRLLTGMPVLGAIADTGAAAAGRAATTAVANAITPGAIADTGAAAARRAGFTGQRVH